MIFASLLLMLSAIAANNVQAEVGRSDSASIGRATAESVGDDRNDPLLFFGGSDQQPYLDWLGTRGAKFENVVFLDSTAATSDKQLENGAAFHWTLDKENTMLQLALVTRATGWMGFGLSENGGMRGADMMVFDAAHPDRLIDAHFMDDIFTPAIDTCHNWECLWSQTSDGFLIVEAQRLFDTFDAQDRAIYYDADLPTPPHLIISAWGETPSWEYHGPKNRAKGAVRFFGTGGDVLSQFHKAMEVQADGSFLLGAKDFAIPEVDTHYQRFCFHRSDLVALGVPVDEPLHIIGVAPVIDSRSKRFVHHYNLMTTDVVNGTCDESRDHFEVLYGWGPGGLPYEFPSILGSPLGVDGFSNYYLDIHYNNPDLEAGFLDSSGVTIYWTRTKRQYDVGFFALADPRTDSAGEDLGEGLTQHTYNCPASCTSLVLPVNQSITILATSFHMHRQGRMATLSVMRDGVEVFSSAVEYFDFDQAGSICPPTAGRLQVTARGLNGVDLLL
jgi:dopamine beta-monooxygenase